MRRRKILLGIGATVGAGGVLGTGAFSNAAVERQMSVTVAEDAVGMVSLQPYDGPNGQYVDDSGDMLVFSFGDESAGLTRNSQYGFDRTFRVGNQGTQAMYVGTEVESDAFDDDALYV